jgi:hypothetical protein
MLHLFYVLWKKEEWRRRHVKDDDEEKSNSTSFLLCFDALIMHDAFD